MESKDIKTMEYLASIRCERCDIQDKELCSSSCIYGLAKKASDHIGQQQAELFKEFESILLQFTFLGSDGKYHIRKTSSDKATMLIDKYFEFKMKYIAQKGKE